MNVSMEDIILISNQINKAYSFCYVMPYINIFTEINRVNCPTASKLVVVRSQLSFSRNEIHMNEIILAGLSIFDLVCRGFF